MFKEPEEIIMKFKNNELEMDDIFIEMFGDKYARSMFNQFYFGFEVYTNMSPDDYKTKESKKELIAELILNSLEYHENQDSIWYE